MKEDVNTKCNLCGNGFDINSEKERSVFIFEEKEICRSCYLAKNRSRFFGYLKPDKQN